MSTKFNKVPATGALLVGAALTGLVAGSTTPAQAGFADASLGATADDLAGAPINASYRADYRYHRHHHRHHRHYYYGHHRRFCQRSCRIIIVLPL